jgi:hypothetical protein
VPYHLFRAGTGRSLSFARHGSGQKSVVGREVTMCWERFEQHELDEEQVQATEQEPAIDELEREQKVEELEEKVPVPA